jgi:hypothetical protein
MADDGDFVKNDALAAALVHNYFAKHGMSDVARVFESEAAEVRRDRGVDALQLPCAALEVCDGGVVHGAQADLAPSSVSLANAVKVLRIRKLVKKNKESGACAAAPVAVMRTHPTT